MILPEQSPVTSVDEIPSRQSGGERRETVNIKVDEHHRRLSIKRGDIHASLA